MIPSLTLLLIILVVAFASTSPQSRSNAQWLYKHGRSREDALKVSRDRTLSKGVTRLRKVYQEHVPKENNRRSASLQSSEAQLTTGVNSLDITVQPGETLYWTAPAGNHQFSVDYPNDDEWDAYFSLSYGWAFDEQDLTPVDSESITACHADVTDANNVYWVVTNEGSVAYTIAVEATIEPATCVINTFTPQTQDLNVRVGTTWYEIEQTMTSGQTISIAVDHSAVSLILLDDDTATDELELLAVTEDFHAIFGIEANDNVTVNLTVSSTDYQCYDGSTAGSHTTCTNAATYWYIGEPDLWESLLGLLWLFGNCGGWLIELTCVELYPPCNPDTNLAIPVCQSDFCVDIDCFSDLVDSSTSGTVDALTDMCYSEDNMLGGSMGTLGTGGVLSPYPWPATCGGGSSMRFDPSDWAAASSLQIHLAVYMAVFLVAANLWLELA